MSLTGALNAAMSGLKANTRAASLISTNIANATNEAYGRRTMELSALGSGTRGGVLVAGVVRQSDPVLVADRMVADSQLAGGSDMYAFAKRLETLVGESGTSGSLTDRITAFENALLSASSNPASAQRLELVAVTATDLTNAINDLSFEVQLARQTADTTIAKQVSTLNAAVSRLEVINDIVRKAEASGTDTASVLDERQALLNEISSIVPLRVVEREHGQIALFTRRGGILLDGKAYEVGFSTTGSIDAATTLGGGGLSGLTLNGTPIDPSTNGMFAGGSLAAQFELRDVTAVNRQAELDGIARDLIERLGPGGPDTTLGATDPGFFTDNGIAFSAANETGIAGRISLNAVLAPAGGGTWRIRDGIGAAAAGEVGDATLLQGIADALGASNVPGSAALPSIARTFIDQVSQFSSSVAGERVRSENAFTFLSAQNRTLREMELSKGVDTDQELQKLMQVEQYYTANAKVISTVDDLFERLLSI